MLEWPAQLVRELEDRNIEDREPEQTRRTRPDELARERAATFGVAQDFDERVRSAPSSSSHSIGRVLVSSTRITRRTVVGCQDVVAEPLEVTGRSYRYRATAVRSCCNKGACETVERSRHRLSIAGVVSPVLEIVPIGSFTAANWIGAIAGGRPGRACCSAGALVAK
jgi:hypothetical protein